MILRAGGPVQLLVALLGAATMAAAQKPGASTPRAPVLIQNVTLISPE